MAQPADQALGYRLDEQVGFLMRQANQRHLAIFGRRIPDFTPTQFATLAKLAELGSVSQNDLGRQTAMDSATMKGVIDRLARRGLVSSRPDPSDMRRLLIGLTEAGRAAYADHVAAAEAISTETLAPLSPEERVQFLDLLRRMIAARHSEGTNP
ncbi:MAG: MarR family transcriptional regulator [Pseudomonadota bacterium]